MLNANHVIAGIKKMFPFDDRVRKALEEADDDEIRGVARQFEDRIDMAINQKNIDELELLLDTIAKTWEQRLIRLLGESLRKASAFDSSLIPHAGMAVLHGRDVDNADLLLKFVDNVREFSSSSYNFDLLSEFLHIKPDPRFTKPLIKHLFSHSNWCKKSYTCHLHEHPKSIYAAFAHPDKYYIIKSLILFKDQPEVIEALREFARYGAMLEGNVYKLLQVGDAEIVKILIDRLHEAYGYDLVTAIIDGAEKNGLLDYLCKWINSEKFMEADAVTQNILENSGCSLSEETINRLLNYSEERRRMAISYLAVHNPAMAEKLILETLKNGGYFERLFILGVIGKNTPNVIKPAIKSAIELLEINMKSKDEFYKKANNDNLEVLKMWVSLADPFKPDPEVFCPALRFLSDNRDAIDPGDWDRLNRVIDWAEHYPLGSDPYDDPVRKVQSCIREFKGEDYNEEDYDEYNEEDYDEEEEE